MNYENIPEELDFLIRAALLDDADLNVEDSL